MSPPKSPDRPVPAQPDNITDLAAHIEGTRAEGADADLHRDHEDPGPDAPEDSGPPPTESGRGGKRGKPKRPHGEIFEGSPVKALGVEGKRCWYQDVRGQVIGIEHHKAAEISHLFGGRLPLLRSHFKAMKKAPGGGFEQNMKTYDATAASLAMMAACDEQGVWSPARSLRGAGCWVDDDGKLIVHCGTKIMVNGEWQSPGRYAGKTYAAQEATPFPSDTPGRGEAAQDLLGDLRRWYFRRPELDPYMLMGFIAAQMLGGALDWRPVGWFTGDRARGKSELQRLLLAVHGGESGLVQSSDSTKAGIQGQLRASCLPVALDELEPDDRGSLRERDIIKLARIASSGGMTLRGSADHKGHSANIYSVFLFSSILIPPLEAQDKSRLIVFDLEPIPKGAPRLTLDLRRLRRIGAQLRRALIDAWPTWLERQGVWHAALAKADIHGRAADNYGTVMALADMLLSPHDIRADVAANWVERLGEALEDEPDDDPTNADDMLTHLLSQPLDPWRNGRQMPVAEWLAYAANLPGARAPSDNTMPDQVNGLIATYGLRVEGQQENARLAIANSKRCQMLKIFEGTQWAGGVWKQAAERLPGVERGVSRTFAKVSSRATLVPFTSLPGILAFPQKEQSGARYAPPSSSPDISDISDF
ncbi:DUF927 domain-containing protein [Oceaniglobus trochenteri]|uniref:DUF927 domain-containing protein n=1 Tax=Oceaniglobus trochenteri TaxID=2763260 RepID=UPI001CFF9137|nr:DUF927 domain-containing protein [Oceaniglobus trochenteri]